MAPLDLLQVYPDNYHTNSDTIPTHYHAYHKDPRHWAAFALLDEFCCLHFHNTSPFHLDLYPNYILFLQGCHWPVLLCFLHERHIPIELNR